VYCRPFKDGRDKRVSQTNYTKNPQKKRVNPGQERGFGINLYKL